MSWLKYYEIFLREGLFPDHESLSELLIYKDIALVHEIHGISVELGCGIARFSLILPLIVRGVNFVIGVDLEDRILIIAKKIFRKYHLYSQADFILADVRYIPLRDSSVEFVHSQGLYEHFEEPERSRVINESARILKRGGFMLCFVPNKLSIFYEILRRKEKLLSRIHHPLYEIPFTIKEITIILNKTNITIIERGGIVTNSLLVYLAYFLEKLGKKLNLSLFIKRIGISRSKGLLGIILGRQIYCLGVKR